MAELMEENDDGENEQEGDRVTDKHMAYRIETMHKKVEHSNPLMRSTRPRPQPSKMPLRQFEARGWQPYFERYGQRRWRRQPMPSAPYCWCESSSRWCSRPAARWRRT